MQQLTPKQIKYLTFPDASVFQFELDLEKRILRCATNISHVAGEFDYLLGHTHVTISDWSDVSVKEWDGERLKDVMSKLDGAELKDICENVFEENIILKGFTKGTDYWTEYKFSNAKIEVKAETFVET